MKLSKHNLAAYLKDEGYKVEPEFIFASPRKFRADWKVCKDDKCCLVEYEGVMSKDSRHTNKMGFSKDCQKYNLAQIKGYSVFRYTAITLNDIAEDLRRFFIEH